MIELSGFRSSSGVRCGAVNLTAQLVLGAVGLYAGAQGSGRAKWARMVEPPFPVEHARLP